LHKAVAEELAGRGKTHRGAFFNPAEKNGSVQLACNHPCSAPGWFVVSDKGPNGLKHYCEGILMRISIANKIKPWIVFAVVLGFIAGCGGGGGSGGAGSNTESTAGSGNDPIVSGEDINGPDGNALPNLQPVADAGTSQTITINSLVTVNGSQSYDPDENYPLTFNWNLNTRPEGSDTLLHADNQLATFRVDREGDYVIELTVTDQRGAVSTPAVVVISTFNSAPLANAGPDQSFTEEGTIIHLDGSRSYDPDDDPITYKWILTGKPLPSGAELNDENIVNPMFVADFLGIYTIELVVTDVHGMGSVVDSVIITSENVSPVAHAGINQVVYVGDTVSIDGSGSYDVNMDLLSYRWNISARPEGSAAELVDFNRVIASFVPDMPGGYTAILVVSDGLVESDPHGVEILAIDSFAFADDAFIDPLMLAIDTINDLPDDAFKNSNNKNTLTSKILTVLVSYIEGLYNQDTVNKLINDIGEKMNGCSDVSTPDANDWIVGCDTQSIIHPLIIEAAEYLEDILNP
jgi:hypothetical protein